jgi:hypothetical protein
MTGDPARAITLVAFCRRPAPGVGKRRLAPELGDAATLTISELLLATTLEDLAAWPGPRVVAPADPADEPWARSLPVALADVVAQPEGNLGDRLGAVDRLLRQRGHARLLYIGSDAPVLAAADYGEAARVLGTHDVVLGPAMMAGSRAWAAAGPGRAQPAAVERRAAAPRTAGQLRVCGPHGAHLAHTL